MSYKVPTTLDDIPQFLVNNLELCSPDTLNRTIELIEPAVRKGLPAAATEVDVVRNVGIVLSSTITILIASKRKGERIAGHKLKSRYDD